LYFAHDLLLEVDETIKEPHFYRSEKDFNRYIVQGTTAFTQFLLEAADGPLVAEAVGDDQS